MTPTAEADFACPPKLYARSEATTHGRPIAAHPRPVRDIERSTWDALASCTPWATPFSRWAFQAAWWDAYGDTAHDDTLVVRPAGRPDGPPVGIVPLMHRHFDHVDDAATATQLRHGHARDLTPVPTTAKVTFFGASYHADYATVLCGPGDLEAVAEAAADYFARPEGDAAHSEPSDALDLRRLRCADPAVDALAAAFGRREAATGWMVTVENEDVCPVVTFAEGADLDDVLATLGKKDRHEIRRKVRRAEAAGDVRLVDSADPVADLPVFIDLHQRRWGDNGLFPDTPGGARSRVLFRRLFEEFAGVDVLRLSFLWVGDRRIGALVWFCEGDTAYYYNGGMDPAARDLSPGVVMVERSVRRAIADGTRRLDFLRGDEPYKYEWGAVDEPIARILVTRAQA